VDDGGRAGRDLGTAGCPTMAGLAPRRLAPRRQMTGAITLVICLAILALAIGAPLYEWRMRRSA